MTDETKDPQEEVAAEQPAAEVAAEPAAEPVKEDAGEGAAEEAQADTAKLEELPEVAAEPPTVEERLAKVEAEFAALVKLLDENFGIRKQ